jgi:DNA repair ATPase RecN
VKKVIAVMFTVFLGFNSAVYARVVKKEITYEVFYNTEGRLGFAKEKKDEAYSFYEKLNKECNKEYQNLEKEVKETKELKTLMAVSEKYGTETPKYKKTYDDAEKKVESLKSYERYQKLYDEVEKAYAEYEKRNNEFLKECDKYDKMWEKRE